MKIKTFPIQFLDFKLEEIRKAADKHETSIKDYILLAIEEKLLKERG